MKLPFLKFYPADYMRDTRALSLAARGGWVDVLCMLHGAQTRGTMTLPVVGWARVMGATVDQAEAVISELDAMGVAEVHRHSNGDVTLSSRRMKREHISREQTRLRVARHRSNAACNGDCNADVTGNITEVRRQKSETKKARAPSGAVAELVPIPDALRTAAFESKWAEYIAYRRQNRMRTLQPASVAKQWAEMAKWGHDAAIESIDTTIRNSWQGLFEPRAKANGSHPSPRPSGPERIITRAAPSPEDVPI